MNDPGSLSTRFGAVLRRRRLEAGISLRKLADRSGRDLIHLGFIERGIHRASIDMANELCHALGLSLSQLIMEAEKPDHTGESHVQAAEVHLGL